MQQLWGPGEHSEEMESMLAEKKAFGEQIKGVKDLLTDRSVRWQMISLILICGAMQLIGINAVKYFLAYYFEFYSCLKILLLMFWNNVLQWYIYSMSYIV